MSILHMWLQALFKVFTVTCGGWDVHCSPILVDGSILTPVAPLVHNNGWVLLSPELMHVELRGAALK